MSRLTVDRASKGLKRRFLKFRLSQINAWAKSKSLVILVPPRASLRLAGEYGIVAYESLVPPDFFLAYVMGAL